MRRSPMRRLPVIPDLRSLGDLTGPTVDLEPAGNISDGGEGSTARTRYDESSVDEEPRRIRYVKPTYPRGARRLGISGWVVVEFTVAGAFTRSNRCW